MPRLRRVPRNYCQKMPTQKLDLAGQQIGDWEVLHSEPIPRPGKHQRFWCRCKCGTERSVNGSALNNRRSLNCGCSHLSPVPLYARNAYMTARSRCRNPNSYQYHQYGARGIEFRFDSYKEFWEYVGPRPSPRHSLDRINNDGHYEKGNVRWATPQEQARNKRKIKAVGNFSVGELLDAILSKTKNVPTIG